MRKRKLVCFLSGQSLYFYKVSGIGEGAFFAYGKKVHLTGLL